MFLFELETHPRKDMQEVKLYVDGVVVKSDRLSASAVGANDCTPEFYSGRPPNMYEKRGIDKLWKGTKWALVYCTWRGD